METDIVMLAVEMAAAVQQFLVRARRFYYVVMLFGCRCPECSGTLAMVAESRCRCDRCSHEFDPTVVFQKCSSCGGVPVLKVRRYRCRKCGCEIRSLFLFDGLVYDAQYFRRKMAESRRRRAELKQRVQAMLAECHSHPLTLNATDLKSVPGLTAALNTLTGGLEQIMQPESRESFDLGRYQEHVSSCLKSGPAELRHIPPLIEDRRRDLIWRFIAVIFLEHDGLVHTRQQGPTIRVMKAADREGQDLSGEA